jgi:uncharacterized protein (TIGR00369 family)
VDRSLAITWSDPMALAGAAPEREGIDFLRAIADGELPPAPIQELLGFELIDVGDGETTFALVPGEQHYNPIGVVHGGVAGTLLDSAMGAAVHSTLPKGHGYTTLETSFRLTAAIRGDAGRIVCTGRVVNKGSRVATAEGRLVRESDDRLLAHGTSTCLLLGG